MTTITAFTGGQVITGDSDEPILDGVVLVVGDTVAAVGPRASVDVPGTARIVDCRGGSVLPGLVDCHEHLLGRSRFGEGTTEIREPDATWGVVIAHYAQDCLERGVTTVRVPGSHHGNDLAVRAAFEEGFLRGPRMVCAGEAITMTGGHGQGAGVEVDGPVECMRAARTQLSRGADFLKVMTSGGVGTVHAGEDPTHPELTVAEVSAVVQVANAARKYVAAHADGVEGIATALDAGVHCIEHGIYLTEDQARFMADRQVRLVPTLTTIANMARRGDEWGLPREWIDIAGRTLDIHRRSFQNALDAGVVYGTGTDGYGDIVDEIREFTGYGVATMRALQAATRDSAQIARPGIRVGVLAEGWQADVLVVDGDPLADLEALRRVRHVMVDGRSTGRTA
jgi:imidazolonepropionase-like amidohydrolase